MATKLTLSIFFLLFALSYAQSQPQHDVVAIDDVADLPFSDSNIFLPSQKTEPDLNKPVEIVKPVEVETVPLTFVSFRPINRHFRQQPMIPVRHGLPCGGFSRRGMVKPWLMRFEGGKIPYGKDMIVEKDGKKAEDMAVKMEGFGSGSEVEIIPLRRHRHHHHHHLKRFHEEEREFEHEHDDEVEEEEHHHHHHHHPHHHHEGGFLGKIRKFLHHF